MSKKILVALLVTAMAAAVGCGDDPAPEEGANNGDTSGVIQPFSEDCTIALGPVEDAEQNRQNITAALVEPSDGDVICLGDGTFSLSGQLTLNASVSNIEIRGQSQDGTILDFEAQEDGSNGVVIDGIDDFRASNFTIKNTQGDALKVQGNYDGTENPAGDGIELVNLTVTWDGGAKTSNGAYGIYPVNTTNVLVENCEVSYAADAGIYVGQSDNVIVRNNVAFGNVAGLEIENTSNAEVHDNHLYDNTGGLLVFNLPDLKVKHGSHNKVHSNLIEDNNHNNFAEPGTIVGNVPAGTGMLLVSTDHNEIHDNTIIDNKSTGIAIVSYLVLGEEIEDAEYDPFSESNFVHGNTFDNNGNAPEGLAAVINNGGEVADLAIDGFFNPQPPEDTSFEQLRDCFDGNQRENGDDATFMNFDAQEDHDPTDITDCSAEFTDFCHYQCTRDTLPSVTLD